MNHWDDFLVEFYDHHSATRVSQLEVSITASQVENSTIQNALTDLQNHVRFAGSTGMAEPGAACSSHGARSVGFGDASSETVAPGNCGELIGDLIGTSVNVQGNF